MKKRDLNLDTFKGFAILAIMAWHFEIIPRYYLIWAIPTFLFVTASLYEDKWQKIKLLKIIKNFIWIFSLIFLLTVIFHFFDLNTIDNFVVDDIVFNLKFFIFRNPYLGQLWYFLLYFQLMIGLYFLAKVNYYKKIDFKKWQWGLFVFLISQCFSYFLLFKIGKGVSLNIVSWLFLIWLALFYYKDIKNKFNKFKINTLLIIQLFSAIFLIVFYLLGKEKLIDFLMTRTHDFLFPTFILQFVFLISFFSLVEFFSRIFSDRFFYPLTIIGKYSLYVYLFHQFFYFVAFKQNFIFINIIITIILSIIVGIFLEKIRQKVLN